LVSNWGINGIGAGLVFGQLMICVWFYLRIVIGKEQVLGFYNKFFVAFKGNGYE